jgi:hypothetical protein
MSLHQNFLDAGCDKADHHYAQLYTLLAMFKTPERIMEIGVFEGASMIAWNDTFPDAEIIGIDNNPNRTISLPETDKVKVIFGDAKIVEVEGEFDWIIDDGSHEQDDVTKCFWKYWGQVKQGGWYIIEDVHCAFWDSYQSGKERNWWGWLNANIAVNLQQSGKEGTYNEENPPAFNFVIQDKGIVAIQKR